MFKQKQVVLDSYTKIYLMMKNPKPGSSLQLKINDQFSCMPKTEKVKNYLFGVVPYHALKAGTFKATLYIWENDNIKSQKNKNFTVFFPNNVTQKCFANLEMRGAYPYLKSAKKCQANEIIHFNVSGLKDCPDLEIEYEWKFYKYIHFEPVTNCPDASDFKEVTGLPSAQDNLVLPKNSLKNGYYYLCFRVRVESYEKLACVSIII